ncbi:MAG: leucyl/phenylalanyl-tRNA--protein transferase [Bacteroidetes bacterium]|nr:leucyl/phenylalanyl-tRNA--protein transferase [Bacteroidota bacterium]
MSLLGEDLIFPALHTATPDGLLAIGGDLRPQRLLLAYRSGIFPWFNDDEPILWWSPDPRCVLYPTQMYISKSLAKVIRQEQFFCTFDQDFETVIRSCSRIKRKGEHGTWITEDMFEAYVALHRLGYAHSVEVWAQDSGKLVGGLYGVSVGSVFAGESMFSRVSNASKVALAFLCKKVQKKNFAFVDCQIYNPHLGSLGAVEITRADFAAHLAKAIQMPDLVGNWGEIF